MGGRGASSSGGGGLSGVKGTFAISDADGNDMGLIISMADGKTFWQNARGRISELPENVSAKEYVDRVKNNGGSAQKLTKSDLKKMDAEHAADRKAVNDFLNKMENNKTARKGSAANKTASRVARKPRGGY